jgi:hypothetical protein
MLVGRCKRAALCGVLENFMKRYPRKTRRFLVASTYLALALFACAEFHMLAPALFHGASCDQPADQAPSSNSRQTCALCVLVQTAVVAPAVAIADAPPVALSDECMQEYRTILWCDSSWTSESLRGPPSFNTV